MKDAFRETGLFPEGSQQNGRQPAFHHEFLNPWVFAGHAAFDNGALSSGRDRL